MAELASNQLERGVAEACHRVRHERAGRDVMEGLIVEICRPFVVLVRCLGAPARDWPAEKLGIKSTQSRSFPIAISFFPFLHQKVNRASHDHRFDSPQRCVAMGLHGLSGSGEQYLPCRKFLFRFSGPLQ